MNNKHLLGVKNLLLFYVSSQDQSTRGTVLKLVQSYTFKNIKQTTRSTI